MNFTSLSGHTLTNDEIAKAAPSVFAPAPYSKMSDKYVFVPTIEVVDALRSADWLPVKAIQSVTRNAERKAVTKHQIRFRHRDTGAIRVGDSVAELVLTNSHDGASSYVTEAGLFRPVCANGLIVGEGTFDSIRVKHVGFEKKDVIDASFRVLSEVPKLAGAVDSMRSHLLTAGEQNAFASAALILRYGDEAPPIVPEQALAPRRCDDRGDDLWRTMNRVQENLTKGGLRYRKNRRRSTTREIKSIDSDSRLNKALWTLAEELRKSRIAA